MHTATSLLERPTSRKRFGFSANTTGWRQLLNNNKLTEEITWRHILMLPLTRDTSTRHLRQHHEALWTGKPLVPEIKNHHYLGTSITRRRRRVPVTITTLEEPKNQSVHPRLRSLVSKEDIWRNGSQNIFGLGRINDDGIVFLGEDWLIAGKEKRRSPYIKSPRNMSAPIHQRRQNGNVCMFMFLGHLLLLDVPLDL